MHLISHDSFRYTLNAHYSLTNTTPSRADKRMHVLQDSKKKIIYMKLQRYGATLLRSERLYNSCGPSIVSIVRN